MKSKFLKPTIILFVFLFIGLFLVQKNTYNIHSLALGKVEILTQEELFSKNLEIEVIKLYKNSSINYDQLNIIVKEYESFHKHMEKEYENDVVFQKIVLLGKRKLEHIDYFKRSNSVVHNSNQFLHSKIINYIFVEEKMDLLDEEKRTLVEIMRLLQEYGSRDENTDNKIKEESEKLQEVTFTCEQGINMQKLFLMHIKIILEHRSKLRQIINNIDVIDKTISYVRKEHVFELEAKEINDHKIDEKKEWIMMLLSLSFLGFIYYFADKVVRQEEEIQKYSIRLEEDVEKTTNSLNEKKKIYEKLFNESSDGIVLVENGLFTDSNDAYIKLLGYSTKDEILNKPPSFVSPEFQPDGQLSSIAERKKIEELFDKGSKHFEWVHKKSDGSLIWCDVSLTHIVDDGRDIIYGVAHDISMQKELQKKWEDLNDNLQREISLAVKKNNEQTAHMLHQSRLAQMGEMLSMIAHQWRQPLSAISSISGTLSLDVETDAYKKEYFQERLDSITDITQHLSSTIDDFRDFFKQQKKKEKTSLEEIVHSSLDIVSSTFESKGTIIKEDIVKDISWSTYTNEVRQVLLNIFKNAQEAIEDKGISEGEIWIRGYEEDERIYLVIEDNAGGIPEESIDKVFDPYFSSKIEKEGTGLGLYMSKTIIQDHCTGEINVKNSDRGACFTLSFPKDVV